MARFDSRWSMVIHGGAGQLFPDTFDALTTERAQAGLAAALEAGAAILRSGGCATDAVIAAVSLLEDDPVFNAGRGSVFTSEGTIEMDAAVMDGQTRSAGAVVGVTRTRNPIQLAARVMTHTPHVMLAREGADQFGVEQGLETADPDWFGTDERRRQWAELKVNNRFDSDLKYGTVGAVACDTHGHVAAATSTGGLTGKKWGRIGDTPLVGAGTYADDRGCAVSCTGAGEYFIRNSVAGDISARMRLTGMSAAKAARQLLNETLDMGGAGGVIYAAPDGEAGWAFTTPGMYRARVSSRRPAEIAIFADPEG